MGAREPQCWNRLTSEWTSFWGACGAKPCCLGFGLTAAGEAFPDAWQLSGQQVFALDFNRLARLLHLDPCLFFQEKRNPPSTGVVQCLTCCCASEGKQARESPGAGFLAAADKGEAGNLPRGEGWGLLSGDCRSHCSVPAGQGHAGLGVKPHDPGLQGRASRLEVSALTPAPCASCPFFTSGSGSLGWCHPGQRLAQLGAAGIGWAPCLQASVVVSAPVSTKPLWLRVHAMQ